MESQTSFIPKKSLTKEMAPREAPVGLLTLLATLVFFVSLLGGAGVYFYKILLDRDIKSMGEALDRAQKAFEPSVIVELERLDRRIISANEILKNHVVVTPVFKLLQDTTISNVRYTKFLYDFTAADKITLSVGGVAKSYAYVAVQSDILGKSKFIGEHIFSNLNLDNVGNVTFDLAATLDPSLVLYGDVIDRGGSEGESQ